MNSEEKIRSAFANKDWQEIKVTDSWQIFKIMAEFVDGFEKLSKIGPCVSIFGSARTAETNPYAYRTWLRCYYWWWARYYGSWK